MQLASTPSPRRDLFLLAALLLVFFSITLGSRPYSAPSESRYIEIGRQMAETNDWVTPRINGVKYFEKPPLFYWIQAAQFELFGWQSEFSGRLWTMLFGVALCLITFATTNTLYNRTAAWCAAGVLATSGLFFALTRVVLLDMPVSFFLSATLFAFLLAERESPGKRRNRLLYIMYISAALATMTKGLIGILIPGMVIGAWIASTGKWKILREVKLLPGLFLFLLITAPWHILAGLRTPEFWHFYFIHEHVERFLTKVHGRYEPWWFFIPIFLGGLMPWLPLMWNAGNKYLRGAWKNRATDATELYFVFWIALPFIFFSLSDSKLPAYVLPFFPPVAIWIGRYLAYCAEDNSGARMKPVLYIASGLLVLVGIGSQLAEELGGKIRAAIDASNLEHPLAALCIIAALALAYYARKNKPPAKSLPLLFAAIAATLVVGDGIASAYAKESTKAFAAILRETARPEDEIATFRRYYQDFPVYLDRNVTIVNWEGELAFGRSIEPATHQWMIDEAEFWKRWQTPGHRMFMVTRKNFLPGITPPHGTPWNIISDNGQNVLIANH